jgi:hypothetical protein
MRFWSKRSELIQFISKFPHEFVLSDQDTYVALKHVFERSQQSNKPLFKSNEMQIDMELLERTLLVTSTSQASKVIELVMKNPNRFVAMDMEGVHLGSEAGFLTLVQMAVAEVPLDLTLKDIDHQFETVPLDNISVYVFDILQEPRIMNFLLPLFKSTDIVKVFHGCSNDMSELEKYKINTRNVFDTLIASRFLHDSGRQNIYALYELYTGEETNHLKKKIKKIYYGAPDIWAHRPLSNKLLYYAALDAYALLQTYVAMQQKMFPEQHHQIEDIMQSSKRGRK